MNKYFWANTALCITVAGVVAFGLSNISTALTPKGLLVKDTEPSSEVKAILKKVVLESFDAGEDEGHQIKAVFQIRNHSDKDVRNMKINCEFADGTGHYLDREQWLLPETLSAGKRARYETNSKRYIHTKAISIICKINELDIVGKPLISLDRSASSGHGQSDSHGHGESSAPESH